jgi:hypothetical protein
MKAVYAAGVDPQKLQRSNIWTHDRILECILTRVIRNEPLQRQNVKPRSLVEAGTKLFGSWKEALVAAGIDSETHTVAINGLSYEGAACVKPRQEILDATSPKAVHRPGTHWSEREVLETVVQRFRDSKPIRATAVYTEERPLYRAALKHFGNWRNTLLAAGLPAAVRPKS